MNTRKQEIRNLAAPSLADLELMAESVFAALPKRFRRLCDGVVIRVEILLTMKRSMVELQKRI